MKVLFTFGGLPHYSNYILSRLNNIPNHEIVVAVPSSGAKTIGDSVKMSKDGINFKIIYLEEKKAFYGNYFLSGMLHALQTEKPDIVVTIWPYILNYIVDFKLKKYICRNNIKLILKEIPFDVPVKTKVFSYYSSHYALTLNEDLQKSHKTGILFYVKHLILKWIRTYYYTRLVDATVNYTDDAYEVCTSYGLSRDKIFVTTNSPDTERIFDAFERIKTEKPILPENPYRIIHVGRLVKWKKVDQILQAMKILKPDFPEIELIIIGNGKEKENLINLSQTLALTDNVKFIGGVYENEDLGRYFLSSSIYILAGMGGLSINEAMAFGKPVICSIADGTEKRLVRDNYNGYYFKPDDVNDLADKIRILFTDNNLLKQFGENSLKIIQEEVNVHTVIKGYVEAFNYVTKNSYSIQY